MNGKKWTEDEDDYLEYFIYDHSEGSYQEVADELGRSWGAVQTRVTFLRQKNKNVGYVKKRYTDAEIRFIRENYGKMPTKDIAERLNRTHEAIKSQAKILGVTRGLTYLDKKDDIIRLAAAGKTRPEILEILNLPNQDGLNNFIRLNGIECQYVPEEERLRKMKEIIHSDVLRKK